MKIKQIEVSKDNLRSIYWMEDQGKLQPGNFVKPKGCDEFWKIDKVHDIEMNHEDLKRNWHVGGL